MTSVAVGTSGTRVRATFSAPIEPSPDLSDVSLWSIDPPLTIVRVVPEASDAPTYADITTTEQRDGRVYTLTLDFEPTAELEDAMPWKVITKSANYTVLPTDGPRAYVKVNTEAGARTVTLPHLSATIPGDEVAVYREGGASVFVARQGSDTIAGGTGPFELEDDGQTTVFVAGTADGDWSPV